MRMKNGTRYAAKLKKVYAGLRASVDPAVIPEPDEPLRRLAIAILGEGCSDEEATRAVDRALDTMVDWNEMRVSSASELNKALGNAIPQGIQRCRKLAVALQAVFDCENQMSLDRLQAMGRRDARHYLEQLEGTDEYAVASVILWSLGGHAIPVNDRLLSALHEADLVHPAATRAEVQAFLERNISANEAKEFCLVMQSFPSAKRSGGRRTADGSTSKKSVSK
jgi:hypothetical protein